MQLKEYVTKDDVRKVCGDLSIRDWSELPEAHVPPEEARAILAAMNIGGMRIAEDDFRQGLEVELEHGTRYVDANVTNNHPLLTGRIVLAHLKESLDYYKRLEVAELEGDLVKALAAGNAEKMASVYRRLEKARFILSQSVVKQLS